MSEGADRLRCYLPGRKFPALSATGGRCALNCSHCEGRLLLGMRAVSDPASLLVEAERIAQSGGTGFLLSGGCDRDGRIPLGPFVGSVAEVRKKWGLRVNLHPGLLSSREAKSLMRSGADSYSIDLHQSAQVIRDILHLERSASAYEQTLEVLTSAGASTTVPHVTVGLDEDGSDALRSIDLAARFDVAGLVVLVFTPIPGTAMERRPPPPDSLVLDVVKAARRSMRCPVALGCVRPRGNAALEIRAIETGVRDIAMPSSKTIEWARGNGLSVERVERCCAVHL